VRTWMRSATESHSGEFFLAWTPEDALLSRCWAYQFAYFGVLNAITTLPTGERVAPHLQLVWRSDGR
jgi:hypothetical protein